MIDRLSATWRIVLRHVDAETEASRAALEQPGLDSGRSEYLRGRIAMAREVAALPERHMEDDD